MSDPGREHTEEAIRRASSVGDVPLAVRLSLEAYGDEVYAFLHARMHGHADAMDVFSMFCEDLLVGLPRFEWRCSARGYCYRLARSAMARFRRSPQNRRQLHDPLSQVSELPELVEQIRTRTAPHLRSEIKERVRALREALPDEDQMLLMLRVDRGLSFRDLAAVMGGEGLTEEALARESARLRKRFELVKEKLRELARQEGLLDS